MIRVSVYLMLGFLGMIGLTACGENDLAPLPDSELPKVEIIKPAPLPPSSPTAEDTLPLSPLPSIAEMGAMVGMTVEQQAIQENKVQACQRALDKARLVYQRELLASGMSAEQAQASWQAWGNRVLATCKQNGLDPQCLVEAQNKAALEACLPLQAY